MVYRSGRARLWLCFDSVAAKRRIRRQRGTRSNVGSNSMSDRIRELRQGPDGALYVLTNEEGDAPKGTAELLRIYR